MHMRAPHSAAQQSLRGGRVALFTPRARGCPSQPRSVRTCCARTAAPASGHVRRRSRGARRAEIQGLAAAPCRAARTARPSRPSRARVSAALCRRGFARAPVGQTGQTVEGRAARTAAAAFRATARRRRGRGHAAPRGTRAGRPVISVISARARAAPPPRAVASWRPCSRAGRVLDSLSRACLPTARASRRLPVIALLIIVMAIMDMDMCMPCSIVLDGMWSPRFVCIPGEWRGECGESAGGVRRERLGERLGEQTALRLPRGGSPIVQQWDTRAVMTIVCAWSGGS